MSIQSDNFSPVVQLPLGPCADLGGRLIEVSVAFDVADLDTLMETANERQCTVQDLIHRAAMNDAFR